MPAYKKKRTEIKLEMSFLTYLYILFTIKTTWLLQWILFTLYYIIFVMWSTEVTWPQPCLLLHKLESNYMLPHKLLRLNGSLRRRLLNTFFPVFSLEKIHTPTPPSWLNPIPDDYDLNKLKFTVPEDASTQV